MVLKKNKKGMFFTLIAIALISLFLVSYLSYNLLKDRKTVNKRINTMNNFVFSLEKDLSRRIYISGYRMIFIFEKRIIENAQYIENPEENFRQIFFNNTLNNIPLTDDEKEIMLEAGFQDGIINVLNDKAEDVNLIINLTSPEFFISQEDPWNVKFTLKCELYIQDKGNLAYWNKTANFSALVPITEFEDPLYYVSTNGKVSNKINRTVYKPFVQDVDYSNLYNHARKSYYTESSLAPNFLQRLEGDLSADSNGKGVESLVYTPGMLSEYTHPEKTIVDYIYFSSANPNAEKIEEVASWFYIDDSHKSVYNLN